MGTFCELVMQFLWSLHEVQIIRNSYELDMYSCELFMSLVSTSLVLHGYNISTSLVLRYEVHMNFIRTACKFIWIHLISFHIKFIECSFELHTKFIWTFCEFHMEKFDFISYEVRKKFIWMSYEARMKLTINLFVVQTNFMWSYGYMVSYGLHINEPPGPSYLSRIGFLLLGDQVIVAFLKIILPWKDGIFI